METKEYVEYLLKNYHQVKREISQLKFLQGSEIYDSEEDTIEGLVLSSSREERVQSSSIADTTARVALIYKEVSSKDRRSGRKELEKVIAANSREILKMDNCISLLEKNIKDTIFGVYIQREPRRIICRRLYISENTLNRYRKKGIEEIGRMFGVLGN